MTDSESPENQTITVEEIAELIAEYEKYRDRLLHETLETAKRAKVSKAATMANLEPQLAQVDASLEELRERQAKLINNP
ncbi:MAG: hypothetical protein HC920_04540 [Oscillatoriales cyanobacterium SM2_3_0]|nr:hypothetical protein [Oscillatoriales cyanobacterium SM2_3_0]